MVFCGTQSLSGRFSVDHRTKPPPQRAVMTIHIAIVLRGMVPILSPMAVKNDPMEDSTLLPTVSTQDAILESFGIFLPFFF